MLNWGDIQRELCIKNQIKSIGFAQGYQSDNHVVVLGYAERGEDSVKIIAETIRPGDKG